MSNRTEAARRKLRHCHREATVTAPLLDSTQNPSMSPIAVTNIILNLTVVSGDEVEGR
jgi:hypothetical protein